jgi:hypothetical protein
MKIACLHPDLVSPSFPRRRESTLSVDLVDPDLDSRLRGNDGEASFNEVPRPIIFETGLAVARQFPWALPRALLARPFGQRTNSNAHRFSRAARQGCFWCSADAIRGLSGTAEAAP